MLVLVDFDIAKARMRVDHNLDDEVIEFNLAAASRAVIRYLKVEDDTFVESNGDLILDSNGDTLVPADVQAAVIVLATMFLKDPSGSETANWPDGYLPPAVKNLLLPQRDPAMA